MNAERRYFSTPVGIIFYFPVYLSQILSAIKILLKQFLIDFLEYHFSSSYTKLSARLQNINPPWENKNVDRVANKTKDWHQDHQDADHFGELKSEKLMPLCPDLHSSQHFYCVRTEQTMDKSMRATLCLCLCVIYLIYINHPSLVKEWMGTIKEEKRKRRKLFFHLS